MNSLKSFLKFMNNVILITGYSLIGLWCFYGSWMFLKAVFEAIF